jgi:ATP-dependent exoDNAse (exonuclease V) beta subunit
MSYTVVSILAGLFFAVSLVLGYATWNLSQKVVFYEEWYEQIATRIEENKSQLERLDRIGAFESDDEVGFFFKSLKRLMYDLYRMGFYDEEDIDLDLE